MTPATFKTLCEAIGLEQEFIAARLDVNVRTVQRWQSSHTPIPAAQAFLSNCVDAYESFLDSEMEAIDGLPEGETVHLSVYRNAKSFAVTFGEMPPLPWRIYERAIQQLALYAVMDGRGLNVEFVHVES